MDTTTGVISGIPTATQSATTHTVTGTGATSGTATSTVNLSVTITPTLSFATPTSAWVAMASALSNVATSTLSGGSFGAISYASSNTNVATVHPSTGVVTPVGAGTATITATQAAVSGVNEQATQTYALTVLAIQEIGGPSSGTSIISGGGFVANTGRFVAGSNPPAGKTFPYGVFEFTAQTTPGGTVTVTVTYPQALPSSARYLKLINGSWVDWTNQVTVSGNTATYSITDNGTGDSNAASGLITDPFGPVIDVEVAQIPTLSEWALMILAGLMVFLGFVRVRRM